ncbi:hypothetical protein J3459_016633 [Metarhizium acridum]|uniref:Uncharacterized protein n=1 Tax=Metarhizium acridum (strain CQMa 102) TaxID=655827 RepID=E9EBQ3_METAQ|nr:uncharacterized protein MAC_07301 [Metarhizium acridum CQMa 102]EFY86612.1 hypothetical protein MAC_07301 [Metarhizium acridum CQMa 102]KAG8408547.1 hypothetical protein J3458_019579 [Metarhizium acridum]KAG8411131.1 hypothetical protein J3459_016633 [Metarhizium acridum]
MSLKLSAARRFTITRPAALCHAYHSTPRLSLADRVPHPRQTLSPRSDENTKSAHDDDVAALEDAPYCRNKTRPEEELLAAASEAATQHITNPLEASGANTDISKPSSDMLTGKHVSIKWEEAKRQRSRYGRTPGKGEKLHVWKKTKKISFR